MYCAECGKRLTYTVEGKRIYTSKWFTCAFCGKPICEKCRKAHIARCAALTWGQLKVNKETGELEADEKPRQFAMG